MLASSACCCGVRQESGILGEQAGGHDQVHVTLKCHQLAAGDMALVDSNCMLMVVYTTCSVVTVTDC